jgi:hypothetical protein
MAAKSAVYLSFYGGFLPAALAWPILQILVWIKGDPHKGGF